MKAQFGIFVWTIENRYPTYNAIRIYKVRAAAEKYAQANIAKNYVVRPIYA